MKKYLSIFFIFLTFLTACGGDSGDDNTPEPTDFTALVSAKTWRVQQATVNGAVDNTTDYSSYSFRFNADGSYLFALPDTESGTWAFNNAGNPTAFQLTGSISGNVPILTLNEDTLEIEITFPETDKEPSRRVVFTLE